MEFVSEGKALPRPDDDTFMRLVERLGPVNNEGCYCWTGAVRSEAEGGYGIIKAFGRCVHVHRLAYARENGGLPEGFDVHHLCGTRLCCNPKHLELASRGAHPALDEEVPF